MIDNQLNYIFYVFFNVKGYSFNLTIFEFMRKISTGVWNLFFEEMPIPRLKKLIVKNFRCIGNKGGNVGSVPRARLILIISLPVVGPFALFNKNNVS